MFSLLARGDPERFPALLELVDLVGRNTARIELLEAAAQSGRRYVNGDGAAQRLGSQRTFPQLQDVKREVPDAVCDSFLVNGSRNLIVNRGAPPFDNPDLRRAMSLTLDRRAFVDIMGQGNGAIGGAMEPPPEGLWGMPAETLRTLPGYGPDVARRRADARQIMEKLGYGPDKRLAVTVAARNVPPWRDPALILIDQLKQIYIDGDLERSIQRNGIRG
jgi:ABC-type transport system substrate-binding protein